MTADLKVVSLQRGSYKDVAKALKEIARQIEDGETDPVELGVVMLRHIDGDIATFGFGPRSDGFQELALIRCGETIVIESILYPEPV